VVKDGEDAVDVKELVNEMEGEADDPAVSQQFSLETQRRTRFKEEYSVYMVGETGCGYPVLLEAEAELKPDERLLRCLHISYAVLGPPGRVGELARFISFLCYLVSLICQDKEAHFSTTILVTSYS